MANLIPRMLGAARLDAATYEEVEADRSATGQAMLVVVLAAVAAGIGGAGAAGDRGFIAGTLGALAGWFAWAFVTWLVGTKVLPEPQTQSNFGELLRTIGFSSSPGLLKVFAFVPLLGGLLEVVVSLWMLAAMIVAVRQALDYRGTGRAVFVCALGFLCYVGVILLAGLVLGAGVGLFSMIRGLAA